MPRVGERLQGDIAYDQFGEDRCLERGGEAGPDGRYSGGTRIRQPGIEGKIEAVHFARTKGIPFFGICLGMQCAVIEFARNVLDFKDAASTEMEPATTHPVIDLMEEQKGIVAKGGTMRLGAYPCSLLPGSKALAAYGTNLVYERHRHRYEFNNEYLKDFEAHGMKAAGVNPESGLVEVIEIRSIVGSSVRSTIPNTRAR